MLQHEDGLTTIPPPDYGDGQVPLFDRRKKTWTVIPVARQRFNSSPFRSKENPA